MKKKVIGIAAIAMGAVILAAGAFAGYVWWASTARVEDVSARIETVFRIAEAPPNAFFEENRQAFEELNALGLDRGWYDYSPRKGLEHLLDGPVTVSQEQSRALEKIAAQTGGYFSIDVRTRYWSDSIAYHLPGHNFIYLAGEKPEYYDDLEHLDGSWYVMQSIWSGWSFFVNGRDTLEQINGIAMAKGAGEYAWDALPLPDDLAAEFDPEFAYIVVTDTRIIYHIGLRYYLYTFDGCQPDDFFRSQNFAIRQRLDDNWFYASITT